VSVRTQDRTERDAALLAVEQAFTALSRRATLPRLRVRLVAQVGAPIEPGLYPLLRRVGQWAPIRTSDLAARIGLDVSTVSRQLAGLEKAGLVVRKTDPGDKRAALLKLSGEGKRVVIKIQRARREVMGEALAEWPIEDVERLAELLEQFTDALDAAR
jgi:DNA-binding MarR family transcriptional regulator